MSDQAKVEEIASIPEQGEFVLCTAVDITSHGVYVTLDEYNRMKGFLHVSEIATGRVRHIERFVRISQKLVVKVSRVNVGRKEVDVSLRQVSGDDKKRKLLQVKRDDKAKGMLDIAKTRLNVSEVEDRDFRLVLAEKFGSTYDALEEVVRRGPTALDGLKLSPEYIDVITEISREKMTIPSVFVSGTIEITNSASNGVEVIKEALIKSEKSVPDGTRLQVTYQGSSRYMFVVTAENYKLADKILKSSFEVVGKALGKKGSITSTKGDQARKTEGR